MLQLIILIAQAPFRFINRLSKLRGSNPRKSSSSPVSAHRIRIVESKSFQDMGPAVATLLRWSYFDLREDAQDTGPDAVSGAVSGRVSGAVFGANTSGATVASLRPANASAQMGKSDLQHQIQNEILKGIRRQTRVVLSCSEREVQVKEPDGLTVIVDDVCDLNNPDPTLCLQKIMLALRPKSLDAGSGQENGQHSSYLGGYLTRYHERDRDGDPDSDHDRSKGRGGGSQGGRSGRPRGRNGNGNLR